VQGCALVSSLFFTPGSNVFIEDPSYFLAVSMFRDYGMNMISVESDAEGTIPTLAVDNLQ
jgi:2-aminoadipate transaminase